MSTKELTYMKTPLLRGDYYFSKNFNKMKKLVTLALIACSCSAKAQLNVSLSGTNKGAEFKIGDLVDAGRFELDFQAGIRGSREASNPFLGSIAVGLPLYVTEEIVLTPAAGAAIYQIQVDKEFMDKGTAPYGSFEIGWERIKNDGSRTALRVFITAQYCKVAAFGAGLRGFFR